MVPRVRTGKLRVHKAGGNRKQTHQGAEKKSLGGQIGKESRNEGVVRRKKLRAENGRKKLQDWKRGDKGARRCSLYRGEKRVSPKGKDEKI